MARSPSLTRRPSPTLDDRLRAFLAFVDAGDALDPEDLERTLTDDEVDHELAAAGFDVAALTAHARAEHDDAVAILAAAESTSRQPKVILTTSGVPLSAEDLRYGAASAAVRGQWARCLELLDQAKRIDPEGDRTTEVQERRKLAERMLGGSDASTGVEETP
jgi:hypothetical protein